MLTTSTFLAASSLFSIAFTAPIPTPSLTKRAFSYTKFGGNGTPDQGWPYEAEWKGKFETLWEANHEKILKVSCAQFGANNNNKNEIDAIKAAIIDGSKKTNIPAEFILALVMQESKGCVRAPTTNYGHDNPGLMQSFEGKASCSNVKDECPANNIQEQIFEGLGIGRPFGLQQAIAQGQQDADGEVGKGVERFYRAARIYNSGRLENKGKNLGAGIATHCYASDVANRLLGWTDEASSCEEATIGSFQGGPKRPAPGNSKYEEGNGNTNTEQPQPQPTPTQTPTQTNPTPKPNAESNTSAPKAPGSASNCKTWYTVKSGDTCATSGHESALRNLNQIDSNCGNLWLGYAYCIEQ